MTPVPATVLTRPSLKSVWWDRDRLDPSKPLTVFAKAAGRVHWGTDGWQGIQDSPLQGPDAHGTWSGAIGPLPASVQKLDLAVAWATGQWENNGGADFHVVR